MSDDIYEIKGITCNKCVATVEGLLVGTKYKLEKSIAAEHSAQTLVATDVAPVSWLSTYKPLLIVLAFILLTSILVQMSSGYIQSTETMRYFMAGFFLVFSFFKLLDISAFADAYMGYDLLARRWRGWGQIYPFVELGLGAAYLVNWQPIFINTVTLFVMGFSSIGVIQAVHDKRKIQCACLGAVFKLPMSTVTIVEDLSMVLMAAAALGAAV